MSVIEWSSPPRRGTGWMARLTPVMERPGEWALVHVTWAANSAACMVRDLRKGRLQKPPGLWEFRCGKRPDLSTGVWARYMGGET